MCVTDLDPDLKLTEHEHEHEHEHEQAAGEHRTEGRYAGVAWGRLAGRRDGQEDLDGQDVAKPRA
jgi:hypothetical protein